MHMQRGTLAAAPPRRAPPAPGWPGVRARELGPCLSWTGHGVRQVQLAHALGAGTEVDGAPDDGRTRAHEGLLFLAPEAALCKPAEFPAGAPIIDVPAPTWCIRSRWPDPRRMVAREGGAPSVRPYASLLAKAAS